MDIHVVRPGDTISTIARTYGVPVDQLLADNQLPNPNRLAEGQTIVIQYPAARYTVRPGDTLSSIALRSETSVRQLLRDNPALGGEADISPGQTLVLSYGEEKTGPITVTGYAYPFIDKGILQRVLPISPG